MTNSNFVSHVKELDEAKDLAAARALEIIGGTAETYAKKLCRTKTGLLKNSITHALDGGKPKTSDYKADKGDGRGSYSGHAPKAGAHKRSVLLGTNVYYAPFNELGTRKMSAQPFLRPAIENHAAEYKKIIETEFRDAGIGGLSID